MIMPFLGAYLSTDNYTVYTYGTLDRLLLLKRNGVSIFSKIDLAPLLQDILATLTPPGCLRGSSILASILQKIEVDLRPEKLAENDFLVNCNLSLGGAGG
jgi:hypothetical protein